jgi:hypothetical protein
MCLVFVSGALAARGGGGGSGRKAGRGGRGRRHDPPTSSLCCAALISGGSPREICAPIGVLSSTGSCGGISSRTKCERAQLSSLAQPPANAAWARQLCAWIGGRCAAASAADCAEPPAPLAAPDYYGETAAYHASCGHSSDSQCIGLSGALARYARLHTEATRSAWPPGGMSAVRLLVIRDHWVNVGMGFMPSHVATVVLFCLTAGIYVYFENYGRYDWARYFYGEGGLDLRWTPARQRMWRSRFRALNVSRTHVEVWHEDNSRRGDEEWETSLSQHLANSSARWIHVNGWATTINWRRVLQPAFGAAVADFLRRAALSEAAHGRRLGATAAAGAAASPVSSRGPSWACMSCAIWALFRPRAVLRRALATSPIASSAPLVCLKARTMYAEDKRFFPDTTPPTLEAIDKLWLSYSGQMGDVTFWGPRERLRCVNHTAAAGGGGGSGGAGGGGAGHVDRPLAAPSRAALSRAARGLVLPSSTLHCMERVRSALGKDRARLFVAVDAPRLQETIFLLMGERAFITPGVGVDPTNEYRDEKQTSLRLQKPKNQGSGEQDLSERNLIKVSLDYFIQGFCLSAMTLRPSAFYAAAGLRTSAIRRAIWRAVVANLSASASSRLPACGARTLQASSQGTPSLDACQRELCGVDACNLNQ